MNADSAQRSPTGAERAEQARPIPWRRDFLWPAVILALLTVVIRVTSADLAISDAFHDPARGWVFGDFASFRAIYHQGVLPALYVTGIAVLLLVVGLHYHSVRRLRKIAVFLVLLLLLGPGLIVNATLKEHWGRPRPRNVEAFGGSERFEKVWDYDASSPGKSFPSGHASMGFYFFGAWFLTRRWGRWWAWGSLAFAIGLGLALGFTRIVQGGHFASDILWSAGVCYFTAAGLYHGMNLRNRPFLESAPGNWSRWRLVGVALGVVAIGALAVGFPYHDEKLLSPDRAADGARVSIEIPKAALLLHVVDADNQFEFASHVEGFGLPGSKVIDTLRVKRDESPAVVDLRQRVRGWFIGWEQPAEIAIPADSPVVEVRLENGSLRVDLTGAHPGSHWDLTLADGDVTLIVPDGLALKIETPNAAAGPEVAAPGIALDPADGLWKRGDANKVSVEVNAPDGTLRVERAAARP